jgi:hypothetical protein
LVLLSSFLLANFFRDEATEASLLPLNIFKACS